MKKNITISVDLEAWVEASKRELNVSQICSDALCLAVNSKEFLEKKKAEVEAFELEQKEKAAEKEKTLDEFLNNTTESILLPEREGSLRYWANKIGVKVDELRKLKEARLK